MASAPKRIVDQCDFRYPIKAIYFAKHGYRTKFQNPARLKTA